MLSQSKAVFERKNGMRKRKICCSCCVVRRRCCCCQCSRPLRVWLVSVKSNSSQVIRAYYSRTLLFFFCFWWPLFLFCCLWWCYCHACVCHKLDGLKTPDGKVAQSGCSRINQVKTRPLGSGATAGTVFSDLGCYFYLRGS